MANVNEEVSETNETLMIPNREIMSVLMFSVFLLLSIQSVVIPKQLRINQREIPHSLWVS